MEKSACFVHMARKWGFYRYGKRWSFCE
jgi:hypothetical protein